LLGIVIQIFDCFDKGYPCFKVKLFEVGIERD